MNQSSGKFWALLPLFIFIVIYLVTSIVLNDFYKMPVLVAFVFYSVICFLLFTKNYFAHKK